jgi:hypothetical protein
MPSREEHIDKSEHNDRLSQDLAGGPYLDWAVTAMFYSTLHLVDAFLAIRSTHPESHEERGRLIRTYTQLQRRRMDYRELEERSKDARYRCLPFTSQQVDAIRRDAFEPLKTALRLLVGAR